MNALSKELSCSAIFVETARELWVDLKDHFSQINGPRIFQIQRDINSISPGNKSISSYFTRLKTLWDELNLYNPLPIYSCGTVKILDDYQQRTHTIQFLMGLNDTHLFVAIFFSWIPFPLSARSFHFSCNRKGNNPLLLYHHYPMLQGLWKK